MNFEYDSSKFEHSDSEPIKYRWTACNKRDIPFKQARDLVDVPPLFTELLDLQKYDDGCLV